MIQAVIFDLDCTLIDRRLSIDVYLDHFLRRFGANLRSLDPQKVRDVLGDADGNGYAAKTRPKDIVAGLDWNKTPTVAAVDKHWLTIFPDCSVAMEGAHDVLDELRESNMALGILTNGSVAGQEAKITELGLDELVDAVIVSAAVGVEKPDRRIFDVAIESLDVDAADAVYVGDHPVNDVQGAIDAGLTAIWLRGWHDFPADIPPAEHVIDSLVEIPALLDSL